MRCSRRSTTWLASAAVLLSACAGGLEAAPQAGGKSEVDEGEVRAAIVEAVRARVGSGAEVRIEDLTIRARGERAGTLVATPEPGMRLGRPGRFSLAFRDARGAAAWPAGYAVATVLAVAPCVRVARPVLSGATLSGDDLLEERSELGEVALQRLPLAADAVGARARRGLVPGELLLSALFSTRRLVQSGDTVRIRFTAESVVAESPGVAAQSGGAGDAIRVVNPTSRKALTARIVGPGEVEVVR